MSDAALTKMIRTCRNLSEILPTMGQEIIKVASVAVDSSIPRFWPTYRAGITEDITPNNPSISLMASKIEGAVNQKIIDWAQKVFPVAGLGAPLDAQDYVYGDGAAYPLRIEESGSPAYPGNRAVGAGEAVWRTAAERALDAFNKLVKKATN